MTAPRGQENRNSFSCRHTGVGRSSISGVYETYTTGEAVLTSCHIKEAQGKSIFPTMDPIGNGSRAREASNRSTTRFILGFNSCRNAVFKYPPVNGFFAVPHRSPQLYVRYLPSAYELPYITFRVSQVFGYLLCIHQDHWTFSYSYVTTVWGMENFLTIRGDTGTFLFMRSNVNGFPPPCCFDPPIVTKNCHCLMKYCHSERYCNAFSFPAGQLRHANRGTKGNLFSATTTQQCSTTKKGYTPLPSPIEKQKNRLPPRGNVSYTMQHMY